MIKDFIPYEQALALKELGFDEECLALYTHNNENYAAGSFFLNSFDPFTEDGVGPLKQDLKETVVYIIAPLYQQAFRWFREKYGLKHDIDDDNVGTKFYYKIRSYTDKFDNYNDIIKPIKEERDWSKIEFYSYEGAEQACLVKLIEIVKTKGLIYDTQRI